MKAHSIINPILAHCSISSTTISRLLATYPTYPLAGVKQERGQKPPLKNLSPLLSIVEVRIENIGTLRNHVVSQN